MHLLRAVPLAHADGDHLRDAALDLTPEGGMRLDAVDDDHAVRLARHPVVIDGDAIRRRAEFDDLHRRADGAAERRFSHAISGHHLDLAVGGRATVRAHRGDEKRLRAACLQFFHDSTEDRHDVRDAPAAAGEGDLRARFDPGNVAERGDTGADRAGDIIEMLRREFLADAGERRKGRDGVRPWRGGDRCLHRISQPYSSPRAPFLATCHRHHNDRLTTHAT